MLSSSPASRQWLGRALPPLTSTRPDRISFCPKAPRSARFRSTARTRTDRPPTLRPSRRRSFFQPPGRRAPQPLAVMTMASTPASTWGHSTYLAARPACAPGWSDAHGELPGALGDRVGQLVDQGKTVMVVAVDGAAPSPRFHLSVDDPRFEIIEGTLKLLDDQIVEHASQSEVSPRNRLSISTCSYLGACVYICNVVAELTLVLGLRWRDRYATDRLIRNNWCRCFYTVLNKHWGRN